jgi:nucleotide-binding universal stress UspA family protein
MQPTIKKILYASDISKGSKPAFRQAVALAHQFNAELVYIHVLETLPNSADTLVARGYFTDTDLTQRNNESLSFLDEAVRTRIQNFFENEMTEIGLNVSIAFRIESGDVAKAILNAAAEIDASMIVMGARKLSVVERMLLGSTSNKVLHQTSKPVLIVPLTDED